MPIYIYTYIFIYIYIDIYIHGRGRARVPAHISTGPVAIHATRARRALPGGRRGEMERRRIRRRRSRPLTTVHSAKQMRRRRRRRARPGQAKPSRLASQAKKQAATALAGGQPGLLGVGPCPSKSPMYEPSSDSHACKSEYGSRSRSSHVR